jgi:hypothetical protein
MTLVADHNELLVALRCAALKHGIATVVAALGEVAYESQKACEEIGILKAAIKWGSVGNILTITSLKISELKE